MKAVTLEELHSKTRELILQAEVLGEIYVSENGTIIAKIVPPNPQEKFSDKPYFARRKTSAAFRKLDATRKTGLGRDVTELISEEREDWI